jgi:hypothetical protein
MWVKQSAADVSKRKKDRTVRRLLLSFVCAIAVGTASTMLVGKYEWQSPDDVFRVRPREEWSTHLTSGAASGLIIGVLIYFSAPRKRTLICPKCGTSMQKSLSPKCECGTQLEDLDSMKWEDDVSKKSESTSD